jgi:hypothetical protein
VNPGAGCAPKSGSACRSSRVFTAVLSDLTFFAVNIQEVRQLSNLRQKRKRAAVPGTAALGGCCYFNQPEGQRAQPGDLPRMSQKSRFSAPFSTVTFVPASWRFRAFFFLHWLRRIFDVTLCPFWQLSLHGCTRTYCNLRAKQNIHSRISLETQSETLSEDKSHSTSGSAASS